MTQVHQTTRTAIRNSYGWRDGWRNICVEHSCQKEFTSKRYGASFCSGRCRSKYSREKKRAMIALQTAAIDAERAAKDFSTSQDVYDKMLLLRKWVDQALKQFDTRWVQMELIPPALPAKTSKGK